MTVSLLARLRRFARIIELDPLAGDELVRRSLRGTSPEWLHIEGTVDQRKTALTQVLQAIGAEINSSFLRSRLLFTSEARALAEFEELGPFERIVFALGYLEELSWRDVMEVAGLVEPSMHEIAANVEREAFAYRRRVLVVESNDEQFEQLDLLLAELRVVTVRAWGRASAIEMLDKRPMDLIIADLGKPGSDGFTLQELLEGHEATLMNVGDHIRPLDDLPPREKEEIVVYGFGGERTLMRTDEVRRRVRDLLWVAPHRWTDPDDTFANASPDDISDEALAPSAAPIDAEVIDGQLRLAHAHQPEAAVGLPVLDTLRREHLRQALELVADVRAGNAPPRLVRRLDAVAALLATALSEQMVTALGVGVDGLARLLPIIEEEYLALDAADLAIFIADLQDFSNQFPVYRQFRAEASLERPLTAQEDEALRTVVQVLHEQPAEIVATALNERFDLLIDLGARNAGSSINDVALLRSVSNALKAVGRYAKSFLVDVHGKARPLAVDGAAKLIVSLPLAGVLHLLGVSFPVQFAAVVAMLARSREVIEKMEGEAEANQDETARGGEKF